MSTTRKIALAPFLSACPHVRTLGIRPGMGDYTEEERECMRLAERIFFPTPRFVSVFKAIGKATFPSPTAYLVRRSRLHQQVLFKVMGVPHGRTRIYFGARQKRKLQEDFRLPVEIMAAAAIPGRAHTVSDWASARALAASYNPVIVRQSAPGRDCIRLTSVQFTCLGAAQGHCVDGGFTPHQPLPLEETCVAKLVTDTEALARRAGIDDIAVDWGLFEDGWHILQLASPPLRIETPGPTISRHEHVAGLIATGLL